MRRLSAIAALAAAAMVLAGTPASGAEADARRMAEELASGTTPIGTDFALRDPRGRTRRLSDFRGKVVLVYFGYTFCPDVCPTDLLQISRALRALGKRQDEVVPLFITLDPERDTAALLGPYVKSFHPRIVALRGSEAETRRVASAFKVYYEKVTPPGGSAYAIDHAAYTFILDRSGRYRDHIPPGTPSGRTAEMLREALDSR